MDSDYYYKNIKSHESERKKILFKSEGWLNVKYQIFQWGTNTTWDA